MKAGKLQRGMLLLWFSTNYGLQKHMQTHDNALRQTLILLCLLLECIVQLVGGNSVSLSTFVFF